MRKLIIPIIALLGCTFSYSCKYMSKEPSREVNIANNEILRDSLKKTYPSLQMGQIGCEVKDFQDVTVTLGDKELYNMPDEKLQEVSQRIGQMVYHIYDANNYLDKGTLILVESETTMPDANTPKKTFDLHLADIVKANEK